MRDRVHPVGSMSTSRHRLGRGYILDSYRRFVDRQQYRPVPESIEMAPPTGFQTDVPEYEEPEPSAGRADLAGELDKDVKISPSIPFTETVVLNPQKERATFASENLHDFSKPIDTYEGRHRWDPNFEWDEKEENKLVRKVSSKSIHLVKNQLSS